MVAAVLLFSGRDARADVVLDWNVTMLGTLSGQNPFAHGVTLRYTALKQIVEDVDDARVFGGIHFRFDQEAGAVQGKDVGSCVYRYNLQRRRPQ